MVLVGALLLYSGAEPGALFGPLGECRGTATHGVHTLDDNLGLSNLEAPTLTTAGRALAVNMCVMHALKQIFRVPRPAWAKGPQLPNRWETTADPAQKGSRRWLCLSLRDSGRQTTASGQQRIRLLCTRRPQLLSPPLASHEWSMPSGHAGFMGCVHGAVAVLCSAGKHDVGWGLWRIVMGQARPGRTVCAENNIGCLQGP